MEVIKIQIGFFIEPQFHTLVVEDLVEEVTTNVKVKRYKTKIRKIIIPNLHK